MKRQLIVLSICFSFLLLLTSCSVKSKKYWNKETVKIDDCRKKWIYKDIGQKTDLRVLLFHPKSYYDVMSYPNFVIGISENGDTIGLVDFDTDLRLAKNEMITMTPALWTKEQKEFSYPLFTVARESSENDLLCSVKNIYYGKIITKN